MAKKKDDEFDLDDDGVIKRCEKFLRASRSAFSKAVDEYEDARDAANSDASGIKDERGTSARSDNVVNISNKIISSILNPFSASPYSFEFTSDDDAAGAVVSDLNAFADDVNNDFDASKAKTTAVHDAIEMGIGALYVTSEKMDGSDYIQVKPIFDPTMIFRDPSAHKVDGSDAKECAVVEIIQKSAAREMFPDFDADAPCCSAGLPDIDSRWTPGETEAQIVTYYFVRNGILFIYRLCGRSVLAKASVKSSKIPVVLFSGRYAWLDGRPHFRGVVRDIAGVQKVLSYAQSQLTDRMLCAPKAQMRIGRGALEGNEKYYKNMDRNVSPLLPFNEFSPTGQALAGPERIDNGVRVDDIKYIFDAEISLSEIISGVSAQGIAEKSNPDETAEAVLLRTKSIENNVSEFYSNAKESVKYLGSICLDWYCVSKGLPVPESVKVTVNDGPEMITQRNDARRELMALSSLASEDQKPVLCWAIASNAENERVKGVAAMLSKLLPAQVFSDASPQVQQLNAQINELKKALAEKDQSIQRLNNSVLQMQLRTNSDLAVKSMDNEQKTRELVMKGEQAKEADLRKIYMETQKAAAEDRAKARTIPQNNL